MTVKSVIDKNMIRDITREDLTPRKSMTDAINEIRDILESYVHDNPEEAYDTQVAWNKLMEKVDE